MEGIMFYWIAWTFWVMTTFFMKKEDSLRLGFSLWLLALIILSPYSVPVFDFEISIAGIFLGCSIFGFGARIKGKKLLYLFICSFIIMLAYVCFHLFALFDPVWLVFPRNWMLAAVLVFTSLILQENKVSRILIILLGALQGEVLYALILSKYSFPYLIASFTFLDVMALSSLVIALWNGIEVMASFYARQFNQLEREKQKLS